MSNTAIKVENLSKAYQLGQIGTGTISRDLERWHARIRGKEDPFLKIGETNNRSTKGTSDVVWSLKDINFEIRQGDAVGIIGRNGAGKSTLLKILSKITAPTTGKISGNGRIASLLEVGTGFHPELSGRENIFLNGAILGMRKKEIQRKLDEIVDFAGVERYLDTPVKRYSSGMYVRLAFAVAAHLESEILIVDEVLAVGDAEFQKKCLGKMGEVSNKDGRTVLFVSHNMEAIKKLCPTSILLSNGLVDIYDKSSITIDKYFDFHNSTKESINLNSKREGLKTILFTEFSTLNEKFEKVTIIKTGERLIFKFVLEAFRDTKNVDIGFSIHNSQDNMLSVLYSSYQDKLYTLSKGRHEFLFEFDNNYLSNGIYLIRGLLKDNSAISDLPQDPLGVLTVSLGDFYGTGSIGHQTSGINFLFKGKWI
ncbi:MAG: ABC transporter ATP-binding protein [Flavobacterium sp.]|nr:MAG: ABC transporter ATP-binding protein [Flavobacterium sp.]